MSTTDVPTLRKLYRERQLFQDVSDNARLIVSERWSPEVSFRYSLPLEAAQ